MTGQSMQSPSPVRRFAGWRLSAIATAILLLLALLWAAWATKKLVELDQRRMISVSLASLVGDFVTAESRNGGTPEQAQARTAAYLAAVNRAIEEAGRDGTVVLVTEAVLGKSVPDRTATIRARIASDMGGGHGQ